MVYPWPMNTCVSESGYDFELETGVSFDVDLSMVPKRRETKSHSFRSSSPCVSPSILAFLAFSTIHPLLAACFPAYDTQVPPSIVVARVLIQHCLHGSPSLASPPHYYYSCIPFPSPSQVAFPSDAAFHPLFAVTRCSYHVSVLARTSIHVVAPFNSPVTQLIKL